MTRTPIIAGNWKMYKNLSDSVTYVHELIPLLAPFNGVERVICPTFVALASVAEAVKGSALKIGAQQVHWKTEGAFTSQISPTMLQGIAEYVIIGHSECRQYLNETDQTVNDKSKAALAHGLKPIIAVGESLTQRETGDTDDFVGGQVRAALNGITEAQMADVVIAYEPIWAIGTGRNADGETAQDTCAMIRGVIRELYGDEIAEATRIQYGGSVKPDNMAEYMSQPDIDGALVGGASLKAQDFTALVRLAAEAKGV